MFYRWLIGPLLATGASAALADVHCVATPAQFDQAVADVVTSDTSDHEIRLLRDTTLKVALADFPDAVTRFITLTQAKNLHVSGGWDGTAGSDSCPQQGTLDPASSVIDAARFGTALAVILGSGAHVTLSNLTVREGQDDTPGDFKPGCLRANLWGGSRLEVNRVRIENCAALGDPAGVQVSINDAEFTMTNSIVAEMYADHDRGVAIDVAMVGGAAELSNNTVDGADAEIAAAAVYIAPGVTSVAQLRNNVVRSRHAEVADVEIGGLSNLAVLVRNHYDTAILGLANSTAVSGGDPGLSEDLVPVPGSILIDSGTEAGSGPLDHRGGPRSTGLAIDVGAIESEASNLPEEIFRSGFEE